MIAILITLLGPTPAKSEQLVPQKVDRPDRERAPKSEGEHHG